MASKTVSGNHPNSDLEQKIAPPISPKTDQRFSFSPRGEVNPSKVGGDNFRQKTFSPSTATVTTTIGNGNGSITKSNNDSQTATKGPSNSSQDTNPVAKTPKTPRKSIFSAFGQKKHQPDETSPKSPVPEITVPLTVNRTIEDPDSKPLVSRYSLQSEESEIPEQQHAKNINLASPSPASSSNPKTSPLTSPISSENNENSSSLPAKSPRKLPFLNFAKLKTNNSNDNNSNSTIQDAPKSARFSKKPSQNEPIANLNSASPSAPKPRPKSITFNSSQISNIQEDSLTRNKTIINNNSTTISSISSGVNNNNAHSVDLLPEKEEKKKVSTLKKFFEKLSAKKKPESESADPNKKSVSAKPETSAVPIGAAAAPVVPAPTDEASTTKIDKKEKRKSLFFTFKAKPQAQTPPFPSFIDPNPKIQRFEIEKFRSGIMSSQGAAPAASTATATATTAAAPSSAEIKRNSRESLGAGKAKAKGKASDPLPLANPSKKKTDSAQKKKTQSKDEEEISETFESFVVNLPPQLLSLVQVGANARHSQRYSFGEDL